MSVSWRALQMGHSTCNGKNELCNGIGPGKDMFDSTRIIGDLQVRAGRSARHVACGLTSVQFQFAQQLAASASEQVCLLVLEWGVTVVQLDDTLGFRHSFRAMENIDVLVSAVWVGSVRCAVSLCSLT